MENLLKQFKLQSYQEIENCERNGNFSIRIVTVESEDHQNKNRPEKEISAIIIKKEKAEMNNIQKCKEVYGDKVLAYPRSNKEIKQIKPKNKVKIVQIII